MTGQRCIGMRRKAACTRTLSCKRTLLATIPHHTTPSHLGVCQVKADRVVEGRCQRCHVLGLHRELVGAAQRAEARQVPQGDGDGAAISFDESFLYLCTRP